MNSNMQKNVSGDLTAKKSNGKAVVSSAEPKKLNGKAVVSSADPISGDLTVKKPNGKDVDSSAEPIKRAGHTIISPVPVVSGDPKSKQKNGKAVVTSAEAIKRTGNAGCSCADVVSGKLTTKKLKGKAVDSSSIEALGDGLVLDEVEIVSSRRILVHVQTQDGPVMKLYLWDTAATDFCLKFKAQENTPSVILVTTVNPKRFGGALTISSLSSSRVFLDLDVQPTKDYLAWLGSNSEAANRINADIVTKAETVTIGELFTYIKQEGAKDDAAGVTVKRSSDGIESGETKRAKCD
ncbi:hypothetical protein YC2023_099841 [Brassica napus]